jgi:hypothetical protein
MKVQITSTPNPATVELRLSNAPVVREVIGDVIADLNRRGNWIRGLEMLGPGDGSTLRKALGPLTKGASGGEAPQSHVELKVTYDPSADAGFLYLPYESSEGDDPVLTKCSYSVEDEAAVLGLAADESLVFVRFKVPPSERLDSFMELFGSRT